MIPALIVGGYLGAGKTTLINQFLADPKGLKCTVLVNDFGAINVDADLIASHDGETIALTNGCACCSIGDDLIAAATAATGVGDKPDLLIVEASGVARPERVRIMLLGVSMLGGARTITVINGQTAASKARDKYVGHLFGEQIEQADLINLNRMEEPAFNSDLWRDKDAIEHLADAIGGQLRSKPENSQNLSGAVKDEPAFIQKVHEFPHPIERNELLDWLNLQMKSADRIKGIVEVCDDDHEPSRVLVNLVKGSGPVTVEATESRSNIGKLVSIRPATHVSTELPSTS